MAETTPFQELLAGIRPYLKGRDPRGKKGSLSWLEAVMAEAGGHPGAVRNILYKNSGSLAEKKRLYQILAELYQEAGQKPPPFPETEAAIPTVQVLGRDKKAIYSSFLKGIREGEKPQIVVVGGAATGKGVLIDWIHSAVPQALYINLVGELSRALLPVVELAGRNSWLESILAQLSPAQPYGLQAELQREVLRETLLALQRLNRPLLLRAELEATLAGLPLREASGEKINLGLWLEPLLLELTIPYLAALSAPPRQLPFQMLNSPTQSEAVAYIRSKLPDLASDQVNSLVNKAGRNYAELSRLVLLEGLRLGGVSELELLHEPRLGPLLRALAVLAPEPGDTIPLELLQRVLGRSWAELSGAEKSLLELVGDEAVRPAQRALLPAQVESAAALHRIALDYYQKTGDEYRILEHAHGAGENTVLLALLQAEPARLALFPGIWRESATWSQAERVRLAQVLVSYRAVLGEYAHPEVIEALTILKASSEPELAGWALVKEAEALIDRGDFESGQAILGELPKLSGAARAEELLVRAAIARWRGAYAEADAWVQEARALPLTPQLASRTWLWQGLVAKDAGRFDEAQHALREVKNHPLLVGRARYQEGDMLMRIGAVQEALLRFEEAIVRLEAASAPAEERARANARMGTALRRLGDYPAARVQMGKALALAPDDFSRARVSSEASTLAAAEGRGWEALELAARAEEFFRSTSLRPEEAEYRADRSRFRLAVAYSVWENGLAYRPPFLARDWSGRALELLLDLGRKVQKIALTADRYTSLYLDIALGIALLLPDQGRQWLQPLLGLTNPYLLAQARLGMAETLRTEGAYGEALAQLALLPALAADPGLQSWRWLLEAEILLGMREIEGSAAAVERILDLPKAFREQAGLVFGRVVLELGVEGHFAGRWGSWRSGLALPEGLALLWSDRIK